jgi:hypothetical protein
LAAEIFMLKVRPIKRTLRILDVFSGFVKADKVETLNGSAEAMLCLLLHSLTRIGPEAV